MSQERDRALAIQLDDGRVVVATPRPEDQDRLSKLDQEVVLLTASASGDYDTAGHGYGDMIELDVEGHAITLRLPSPADAEQLRRAVAVGAVTATIIAAGAIAALQGTQAPTIPQAAVPPAITIEQNIPVPQARPDFRDRKDAAVEKQFDMGPAVQAPSVAQPAPAPVAPSVVTTQTGPLPVPQARPDFQDRKDAAVEKQFNTGTSSDMPVVDSPGSQRGGPQ
jgi:hypothetical protein